MSVTALHARPALSTRLAIGLVLTVLLGLLALADTRPAAAAGSCGPPVVSVIACENTQPGDPPSDWQVSGAGDSTIQGFASDVELFVDRPWSPTTRIESRAVDDSGNLETPGAGTTVTVNCPCSIFEPPPRRPASIRGDAGSIEVGVKFTTDTFGIATGIRQR
jgi:hypothetical protein